MIYLDTRDNAIIEDDEKHQDDGDTAGDDNDDYRDIHQLLLS
jgi:hypothetical protein